MTIKEDVLHEAFAHDVPAHEYAQAGRGALGAACTPLVLNDDPPHDRRAKPTRACGARSALPDGRRYERPIGPVNLIEHALRRRAWFVAPGRSDHEVHGEMLRVLTAADYPVPCLVHLLRTAHETHARAALRDMGLGVLHRHCMDALSGRLAMPTREKGDWSIAAPGRCGCRLCGTLGRFLAASNQKQLEWPLARDQRAHIHRIVDAHDLPVSHTTRRLGRP